ncbi:MAG: hypothetical protein HYX68_03975 [Planctomycetes bacterium]|nr:hypothetical protein [Planctomycetota bacterium]
MLRRWTGILSLLLLSAAPTWAQTAKDPLRFVPGNVEWVVKLDRPRALVDLVEKHHLFQQVQKLAGIREYYDTTTFQQLYQLLTYFEKTLGQDRYEILDDISSGGVVLAARLTPPKGVVLIVQSRDESKLRRFLDVGLDVLQKELDRQESKDKLKRSKYQGFDVGQIGPKLTFAIVDGALLVSNESKALKPILDFTAKKDAKTSILQLPSFVAAYKMAPAKKLAWTWLHVAELRKNDGFKNGLSAAGIDPLQMLLFGGLADQLRRTPYIAASLVEDKGTFRLSATMPVGSKTMAPLKHMMLPLDGRGTLPPLTVPRVLGSTSFFLDLGHFYEKRVAILGEKNAKGLDDGERNIAKLLGGIKLSKLFQAMGAQQRVVFAQQKERPYKTRPGTPFPAFALVVNMRDPSFAKDMNSVLRSGALVATFQFGLRLKETTYKDCEMVSYYFSETKNVTGDPDKIRFNFSPSYVKVGNSFVISATAELARDLVDALQAEAKVKASPASMRTKLYASGLVEILRGNQDAALTQLILAQALPPKTAKAELQTILNWVEQLGTLSLETRYGPNDFRQDIIWRPTNK